MKKIIYSLLIMMAFASCADQNSLIYEQKPDERVQAVLDNYSKIIHSGTNGWLFALETGAKGGVNHWVNFTGENTCEMLSDAEVISSSKFPNSATEVAPSSWRLKSVETPVLIFDTYNYMHMLADPTATISGASSNGTGLVTDFEFVLGDYNESAKEMKLKGRFNKSAARMIAVNASQEEAIRAGGLKTMNKNFEALVSPMKYPVFEYNSKKVDVQVGARQFTIKYLDENDEVASSSSAAYLSLKGLESEQTSDLILFDTIQYAGNGISEVVTSNGKMYAVIGGSQYELFDNGMPALPFRFGPGKDYNVFTVNASTLGESLQDPYYTNVYKLAKDTQYNKGSKRVMNYFKTEFTRDAKSGKLTMVLKIWYTNSAGTTYQAWWDFAVQENEDGTITFTDRDQDPVNTNARGQENYLRPIVDYFCKLEYSSYSTSSSTTWAMNKANVIATTPRTFRLDWAPNITPGLSSSLGGFYPVDPEHMEAAGICVGVPSKL